MEERYVPATAEVFQLLAVAVKRLDDGEPVDGDDRVKSEHGFGGREPGTKRWSFTCFPAGKGEQWEFELDEEEVRLLGEDDGDLMGTEISVVAQPRPKPKSAGPSRAAADATSAKSAKNAKKKAPTTEPPPSLGERLLERLVAEQVIELAARTRAEAVAATIERAVCAILDDDRLADDERGAEIADAITGCPGVEELFASDEQLLEIVREIDASGPN